jgi:hypothetical protein
LQDDEAHFRDPIHGHIFFEKAPAAVLATYEIQRLQCVRQLSTCYLVYRSANHTRFEHSVGVAYLAGKAVHTLQLAEGSLPPKIKLDSRDRLVAEIAGIIHDAGHGPFGHMCETVLQWTGASIHEHEEITHQVVRGEFHDIDKEHFCGLEPLSSVLEKIGKSPRVNMTLEEFASMVKGELPPERLFLAELISSPIDVDRIDFIPRDTMFVGTSQGGVDVDSLVRSFRVVETTPTMTNRLWPANELAIDISGLTAFEALLTTRDHMYAEIYSQAVNRAAQAMLVRATKRLLDNDKIDHRQLVRMTDEQLLSTLETEGDDYSKDVVRRIRTRQIFQRIPELEYMYDDLTEVWSEIYRLIKNPELNLSLEDGIGSELSPPLEKGQLIIDLPSPEAARLFEREALVRTRSGPQKLEMVSPLIRFFNKNALQRRWRMMVFAPLTKEDQRYKQIIERFRTMFKLGEPSDYPASVST